MLLLRRTLLITLLCAATGIGASTLPFKRMIVFGDSYSDDGFCHAFMNGILPLSPPYANRFSNGPVWNEYLVNITGWVLENYACGGATTDNDAIPSATGPKNVVVPGIAQQIKNYFFPTLTAEKLAALGEDVLYVIWANGNDFGDNKLADPTLAVERIISSVNLIHDKIPTAKDFLIPNLSGIGKIPLIVSVDQQVAPGQPLIAKAEAEVADVKDALFNAVLYKAASLFMSLHSIKISVFPVSDLYDHLTSPQGAAEIGVTTVTEPCLKYHYDNGTTVISSVCSNPEVYLYWDWYHPTTKIHRIIGKAINAFLESQYAVDHH